MAKEIELKFLVKDNSFTKMATHSVAIRQAYLSRKIDSTVRLRVIGDKGKITVKGRNHGAVRNEWEYDIPVADADEMAQLLVGGWDIEKERYYVEFEGHTWEVDVFHGRHEGLVLAEVELPDPKTPLALPPFVGDDVTGNPAYYNSMM